MSGIIRNLLHGITRILRHGHWCRKRGDSINLRMSLMRFNHIGKKYLVALIRNLIDSIGPFKNG